MEDHMPERTVNAEMTLRKILKTLTAYPDDAWYPYAFSREPLNRKFTDEQRRNWMRKALECGCRYADIVQRESGENTPAGIAGYYGLDISYPQLPENTDRVLFGEFCEPGTIRIYMDAVNKAEQLIKEEGLDDILSEELKIRDVLLAHEIFHFIEEQYKGEIFTRQEKIKLWSVGFFHYKSGIVALSEIAAMSFAKELCNLKYLPYVLDVFLVYVYSKAEAYGLYEEIAALQKKTTEEE